MEMSLGEVLDRFSIVKLKIERIGEPHLKEEYDSYYRAIKDFEKRGVKIEQKWIDDLVRINGDCWDLEWDARKITSSEDVWGEAKKFGLEELGKRSIKVGELMKERSVLKNKINEVSKTGFNDEKINFVGN